MAVDEGRILEYRIIMAWVLVKVHLWLSQVEKVNSKQTPNAR